MCEYCGDKPLSRLKEVLAQAYPWRLGQLYMKLAEDLPNSDEIADYIGNFSVPVSEYESEIRVLWDGLLGKPTEAGADKFAADLKKKSEDMWPALIALILDVDELSEEQEALVEAELERHHSFIDSSLLPDAKKRIADEKQDLAGLTYRAIFLYAGALWSAASIMAARYDGKRKRDLTETFLFFGPDDSNTCSGDRGCKEHVMMVYTLKQIIDGDIIPGHFQCLTSCRHSLVPVSL